jgi:hypothetical protein
VFDRDSSFLNNLFSSSDLKDRWTEEDLWDPFVFESVFLELLKYLPTSIFNVRSLVVPFIL